MRPRKKLDIPNEPSQFTKKHMLSLLADLQAGKLPPPRVQISDDMVTGLRAIVNQTGIISLHAAYAVGGSRPLLKLGELQPGSDEPITIEEARELTRAIQELGSRGIDVQEGLHRRLMAEIKRDGVNWRYALSPPPVKKAK